VDGQQRLTAIFKFVKGTGQLEIEGKPKTYNNLEPNQKKVIQNYELEVYSIDKSEPETAKYELFQRAV
jgi:uncharacterized protein with ParB-like and HNH nuclease domain